jgi:phosphohistidine phosphatase
MDAMSIRTLVILRHAKAANPEGVPDVDRPLTDRGRADAAAAGAWIAQHGIVPDLVLCSPAASTRQTWHGVALGLPIAPQVRYEQPIYAASARTLLATVRAADPGASTVLLIGHNPGLSELSATLDPAGAAEDGLRTAGIAVHTFSAAWTDWAPGTAARVATHTARADRAG